MLVSIKCEGKNGKSRSIQIDMRDKDIVSFIKIAGLFDKNIKNLKTEWVKIKGPPERIIQRIVEKV